MSKYHDIEKDGTPKIDGRYLIKTIISGLPEGENESIQFDQCRNGEFSTFWHFAGKVKVVGWWENADVNKFELDKNLLKQTLIKVGIIMKDDIVIDEKKITVDKETWIRTEIENETPIGIHLMKRIFEYGIIENLFGKKED